jgi:hypothetical protein
MSVFRGYAGATAGVVDGFGLESSSSALVVCIGAPASPALTSAKFCRAASQSLLHQSNKAGLRTWDPLLPWQTEVSWEWV